jgi:DNA-binding beta-propeller fold protein YncE
MIGASGERWRPWRGVGAKAWQAPAALLGALLVVGLALAVLWYPAPPLPLHERLTAALLAASALLAGSLRLLVWLRRDRGLTAEQANLAGLVALAAGGIVVMAAGGAAVAAVRLALAGPALLVAGAAAWVAVVALLALARQDLARVIAANTDGLERAAGAAAPAPAVRAVEPPAAATAAPPAEPPALARRGAWAWLDSKWTLAVLAVLVLVTGFSYVQRLRLLDGVLPAEKPATSAAPAAKVPEGAVAPPLTEVAAAAVMVLAGPGAPGSQPLNDVRGLVVGPRGQVYVLETGAKQVSEFDAGGKFVRRWGGPGQGDGQFEEPVALAVDSTGALHVVDAQRNTIQVFSPEGRFRSAYGGDLALYRPRGLAAGEDGVLYLVDTGRNRVLRLSETGEPLDVIPRGFDAQPPPVDQPTAAVFASGLVYVAEPTRGRLLRLSPEGEAVGPAWTLTSTDTLISARLAVGPAGEAVVAEVGARRVLVVCPGGDRVLAWRATDPVGEPRAAALGPNGLLYVADAEGRLASARLAQGC